MHIFIRKYLYLIYTDDTNNTQYTIVTPKHINFPYIFMYIFINLSILLYYKYL